MLLGWALLWSEGEMEPKKILRAAISCPGPTSPRRASCSHQVMTQHAVSASVSAWHDKLETSVSGSSLDDIPPSRERV